MPVPEFGNGRKRHVPGKLKWFCDIGLFIYSFFVGKVWLEKPHLPQETRNIQGSYISKSSFRLSPKSSIASLSHSFPARLYPSTIFLVQRFSLIHFQLVFVHLPSFLVDRPSLIHFHLVFYPSITFLKHCFHNPVRNNGHQLAPYGTRKPDPDPQAAPSQRDGILQ